MTEAGNKAFEELYMENFSYVYNFIYMKILNPQMAEDICSTTFLKAYERFEDYDPAVSAVRTWLCVIARNTIIDQVKGSYSKRVQLVEELPEIQTEDGSHEKVLKKALCEEVERILDNLTKEERDIVSLRYGMGMKVKEIASMLGTTSNSMTHRITRILDKCRKYEEEAGNELTDFL